MIWNISAFEMSENSKKIDKLLRLAKDLDEPSFQRKSQYQSFKVKKHIQSDDIQQFIEGSIICTTYVLIFIWITRGHYIYTQYVLI